MNKDTSSKRNQNKRAGMIAMIILSVVIIILRIRKMIQLNMIGEETSKLDWIMLVVWFIVLIVNAVALNRSMRKDMDGTTE